VSHIIGIGIDIIEIARIEKAMEKSPERFRTRTFTDREAQYCEKKKHKFQHYAARFAAKEAAMKALGTGWQKGIGFSEIEVMNDVSGKPELLFHGKAKEIFSESGGTKAFVTLTHAKNFAAAQVILSK
jgi:holo-[acyl-carrier protein] synthase